MNGRNWRKQEKIDIKIPLGNSLSNVSQLQAEVAKAEIFMRDLWPSSIPAAIRYEKESLEELDRRIQIDISYHEGETRYRFQAREPFNINLQFRGSTQVQERFADLFDKGKPAIFDTDEIIGVSGSPLLETIFKKNDIDKLSIAPENKIPTVLLLSTINAEKEKVVLYGIEGIMYAGKKEAQFQGYLKETPLMIEFTFPLPPSLGINSFKVNFNFESSRWQNIQVLLLPHFDKLKAFFTSLQEGCLLKIVCEIKGNPIFTATSQTKIKSRFIELIVWHLQLFERIRKIASVININLLYPKDGIVSKDEIKDIDLLHDLIVYGEHRQKANGVKFSANFIPDNNIFKMIKDKDLSGPLVFGTGYNKFKLLGEEFEFNSLRYTLTNSILITDLSKITKDNKKIPLKGIKIQWAGGVESELIISKI